MDYCTIRNVDKKVSKILFGTTLDCMERDGDGDELLDSAVAMGINTLDTARVYVDGHSEASIGGWMKRRKNRNDIVILSKGGHYDMGTGKSRVNRKEMRYDLETSLKQLQTDYIDIYLLYRDDPTVPAGEIVEIFNEMHKEGKIGAFGGSNWAYERLKEANEYAEKHNLIPFTVSSPNYGLAEQDTDLWGGGCVTISGPQNKETREWYLKNDMPVIAYSSLGRGMFSGRVKSAEPEKIGDIMDQPSIEAYGGARNFERLRRCEELAAQKNCSVSQIALSWLLHQELKTFAVVSSKNVGRMQQNVDSLKEELTEAEKKYVNLED